MKWTDTLEIAIALVESHPDIDPATIRFTELRRLVLELPDFWQNLWLAICLSFTLLFFVGVLRFGSDLS